MVKRNKHWIRVSDSLPEDHEHLLQVNMTAFIRVKLSNGEKYYCKRYKSSGNWFWCYPTVDSATGKHKIIEWRKTKRR